MKVVVVTGGSSGIGKAATEIFSRNGFKVYEFSRSGEGCEGITHVTCDVTDESSVKRAFSFVYEEEGRLDVLVNNAGFGISGAVEYTSMDQAKKQFDVNFFGAVCSLGEAVKYMRRSGGGTIVNVSSLAAELSIPFQTFYSASKAAINSLTLAAANELRPFNIKVCAVMPGDVKTGFTAAREKSVQGDDAYSGILKKSVSVMEKDEQNGMSPKRIAEKIFSLSQKKNPKPLSTVGLQYKTFAVLSKLLPVRAVNYMIGQIYAK